MSSRNLKASPYGGKQKRFGDKRVWRFVILTRGRVRLKAMPTAWKQVGSGMAEFIHGLEPTTRKMVRGQGRLPRVIFTDRGPGLYQASSGHIVKQYYAALQEAGFHPFAGVDASWQPADLPDVLPHETVAGWCRTFFSKNPFRRTASVEENVRRFRTMLAACEDYINTNYAVEDLCRSFPTRLRELESVQGGRLRH